MATEHTILKAYKFRIYPNADQTQMLNQTFGCARVVWNKLVENFNAYDKNSATPLPVVNEKTLKDSGDYPWLKDVSAAALQQKRIDFTQFKKQFFDMGRKKKIGRPKFKKKGNRQSYRLTNQGFSLNQESSTIRLEKIGHVSIVLDRRIPDNADYRSVTVSKTPSGKFFASVLVRQTVELLPSTGRMIGIDVGLKDLFVYSDGSKENNSRWFRESQSKLARAQRHLSRKKKGSNRRNRQRLKVARCHEKVVNCRDHYLHEKSTRLVRENDVICVEDLNIAGLVKNSRLAKSVSDAGWAKFIDMLEYKSHWYGRSFVKIDRFFPSSKTCSSCGHKRDKMGLDVRDWECPACGVEHDRDVNAAVNILNKGFNDLIGV